MADKLKPVRCGCGGEAKVQRVRTLKSHVLVVMCTKCEIATDYYTTETEAITAWNRAMRRPKVEILPNTSEDKGEMPYCPHCGDELEWE